MGMSATTHGASKLGLPLLADQQIQSKAYARWQTDADVVNQ